MDGRARPRVVIVGAGFAGLWAARTLARRDVEVVVVDRNNYHTFLPLLYQVAAAELEPEQIAYPVRGVFRPFPNVHFAMTEVRSVDFAAKTLLTDGRAILYDYLLLTVGSVTNYFGVPGAAEHCFGLKSLDEGILLRNHILSCFERAAEEPSPSAQRRMLTFTVVGGGATGVEYAGALAELIRGPILKDFSALNVSQARVVMLEASGTILSAFPQPLRLYALRRLTRIGVEVQLGAQVKTVGHDSVLLGDGHTISTETVVWTAGVKGSPLSSSWAAPLSRDDRVMVLPTLQLPDHPEVFVAGDVALQGNPPLPMIAPVAIQQGKHAALNMLALAAGKKATPFAYHDRGTMATIGRGSAVACMKGRCFTGFPAWIMWLFVHLLYLVGFRNRIIVLINWAMDYFLVERAVRLIMPRLLPQPPRNPSDSSGP